MDLIISFWIRVESAESATVSHICLFPMVLVQLIQLFTVNTNVEFQFDVSLIGDHTDPSAFQISDDCHNAMRMKSNFWTNILCKPPLKDPGFYAVRMRIESNHIDDNTSNMPALIKNSMNVFHNFYVGFLSDYEKGWIQEGCAIHQDNEIYPRYLTKHIDKSKQRKSIEIHGTVDIGVAINIQTDDDSLPCIVTFDCQGERTELFWNPKRFPIYFGYSGYHDQLRISLHPWDGETSISDLSEIIDDWGFD